LLVNALFPHRLAGICEAARSRLIHVSTDCVFSGTRGHYMESDISDAVDLYGRTKFLGELNYPHTVTLRTSIIGRELKSRLGLVEWFLAQQGTVRGYERAMYSGLTTLEMAAVIRDHVIWNRDLRGVYHVSSEPISKYRLLQLVKEVFRKDIEILPDSVLFCDRSLDSSRFRQATGYVSRSWKEMIVDLTDAPELYNPLPRVGSC